MRKELYESYCKGKNITVMGLGVLGRGVGDASFLLRHEASLLVTDMKDEQTLKVSLDLLKEFARAQYVLGEHRLEDFEKKDFILKAAGVPYDSIYIQHAKKHDTPVYMSAALVCDIVMKQLEGVTIIGVTGTRGKSTVTQLVAHILRSLGSRVHIGGNVRGVANLPLLEVIEEGDFLVLELDSWQLQGFGDMKISPHIALFTSFMDDHMNYYKNDRALYFNDKANIYRFQKEYDVLIASPQASQEIMSHDKEVSPIIPEDMHFDMKLVGKHNQVAAGLSYEALLQCGFEDDEIREAIKTFSAVEGRLEDMGSIGPKHVRVYNDNNATSPDATIAALSALEEEYKKPPILIVGGSDKGLSVTALQEAITKHTKATILLRGTGTDTLSSVTGVSFDTLEECVREAFLCAEENDVILFSPAFASFGKEFRNEYERNDCFVKAVYAHQ